MSSFVSICFSHSTGYKVKNKTLQCETTYGRLLQNPNVVALATTDRDAWPVFLTYLTPRRCFKVSTWRVFFVSAGDKAKQNLYINFERIRNFRF